MTNEEKILNLLYQMQTDMQQMQTDIQHMQTDIQHMQTDIQHMQTDMQHMQTDMQHMQTGMQQMRTDIKDMQTDITGIKTGQERIEKKLDAVYNQTADLTEFRTETNTKLDKISDDVDFIKHEEYKTKQDIFKLKKNLEIIK